MTASSQNLLAKEKIAFWLSGLKRNSEEVLILLIIALLPSQLGRHFWPEYAIVQGIRTDYLSPTLYLTDILIFLLFLAWAFRKNRLRDTIRELRKTFAISLLFVVFFFCNVSMSQSVPASLYGVLKVVEFAFFGLQLRNFIRKGSERWLHVVVVVGMGIVIESVITVGQFVRQGSLGGAFYFLGERTFTSATPGIANANISGELVMRPYGTFPHPNVLAGYLLFGLILIANAWGAPQIRKTTMWEYVQKFVFPAALVIGSLALFLTMSRLTILLYLVGAGTFLVKHLVGRTGTITKLFQIATFMLLLAGILLSPLAYRFSNLGLHNEEVTQRIHYAWESVQMIRSYPLFGVGIHAYLLTRPDYSLVLGGIQPAQPVHNIYLYTAAELGMLVAIFALLLLFMLCSQVFTMHRKDYRQEGALLLLGSFLIIGFFDHYLVTLQQGRLLFAIIIVLAYVAIDNRKNRYEKR